MFKDQYVVQKTQIKFRDEKGAGYFIKKPPAPFLSETIVSFAYYIKPGSFSQFATSLSALPTVPPFIAKPDKIFAVGQSLLISRTLLPRPLPSWVQ